MENTFLPVKLFSLALVMSLTNLQQKFLKYSYLTDMLKFEDKQVNNTLRPLSQSKLIQVYYKVKTIVIFMASFLIKPVPALLLVYYSATNNSLLSFIMLMILVA